MSSDEYAEAFRAYLRGDTTVAQEAMLDRGGSDSGYLVPAELLTGYALPYSQVERLRNLLLRILHRPIPLQRWQRGILDIARGRVRGEMT